MSHTKGPWMAQTLNGSPSFDYRISAEGREIAMVWAHPGQRPKRRAREQEAADAHIIASAPSLLEAAKLALDVLAVQYEGGKGVVPAKQALHAFGNLRAAIAKAEGRGDAMTTAIEHYDQMPVCEECGKPYTELNAHEFTQLLDGRIEDALCDSCAAGKKKEVVLHHHREINKNIEKMDGSTTMGTSFTTE